MALLRTASSGSYTVVRNHVLRNKSLSWQAKGIYAFMVSLPKGWNFTVAGAAACCSNGVDSTSSALKELINSRYIVRGRVRNANGTMGGSVYTIFDEPCTDEQYQEALTPARESPEEDLPIKDTPVPENPGLDEADEDEPEQDCLPQSITNRPKTNVPKIKKSNTHSLNPNPSNPYPINHERIMEEREAVRERIGYYQLSQEYGEERMDMIMDTITETLCSDRPVIRVAGDTFPTMYVQEKLRRVNSLHVEHVFASLDKYAPNIKNIKLYILTSLFNEVSSMATCIDAEVKHDRSMSWLDDDEDYSFPGGYDFREDLEVN